MASNLFRGSYDAALYSKFRPSPPREVIDSIFNYKKKYLRSKVSSTLNQAVDIGCGSGQSTIALAPYFEKVTGCDISEVQIEIAKKERSSPNIEYIITNCEKIPFPDSSVQLVTSSQAVHWFDTSKLFAEFKRILVPNGVVAIYGYWIPLPKTGDKEKDKKLFNLVYEDLYEKHLGKYWQKERFILENRYRYLVFPFKDVQRLETIKKSECSLAEYIGYLSTWSAYHKLCTEDKEKGKKILKDFEKEFLHILGENESPEEIKFSLHIDFFMLMGHC